MQLRDMKYGLLERSVKDAACGRTSAAHVEVSIALQANNNYPTQPAG